MTLQLTCGTHQLIVWVNDDTAEDTFFDMLDAFCTSKHVTYVLFGHHLMFDILSIFPKRMEQLANGYFKFEQKGWLVSGVYGRPSFMHLRKGKNRRAIMVDTAGFTISRQKLALIAENVCPELPKLALPANLGNKIFSKGDGEFIEYALRDAVIAERFGQQIISWHEQYNVPMSFSGSNLASLVYRKHFVEQPILLPGMPTVYAAMRAYHGGIQRAPFGRGYWPNCVSLDMVSAYPHAMTELPSFTVARAYKTYKGSGRPPLLGVYKVRGEMHATPWPILFGKGFKPVQPGAFQVWATGFEVNAAIDLEQADSIYCEGYHYDAAMDGNVAPMAEYSRHFFTKKNAAKDSTQRAVAKLLLNGLYGKTIQTRVENEPYFDIDQNKLVEDITVRAGGLFNPFIAALITGHCRVALCRLEHRYTALHSATDGIICSAKAAPKTSDKSMGGITIEARGDALILRPKLYVMYMRGKIQESGNIVPSLREGWKVAKYALHGFRGKLEDLERMLIDGGEEYKYTHVVGLKESLRSKQGWRANDFIPRVGHLHFKE